MKCFANQQKNGHICDRELQTTSHLREKVSITDVKPSPAQSTEARIGTYCESVYEQSHLVSFRDDRCQFIRSRRFALLLSESHIHPVSLACAVFSINPE